MITLYHGTSSRYKDAILQDGILPRNVTGVSNWEGKIESKKGFIYLSDAYPVYFASMAAKHGGEECLIIEAQVDEVDLYPDEDYIARCLKANDDFCKKMEMEDIIELIELEDYKEHWVSSLKHNGNVSIKGVNPDQITRHVQIPINQDTIQAIMAIGGDSNPSPLPYQLLGQEYRKAMQALFDHGLEAAVEAMTARWKCYEKELV